MDAFEVSLIKEAAEAEVSYSSGSGSRQVKGGVASAATVAAVASAGPETLETASGTLYRPVVRGLGVPEKLMHGEGARGSLTCLTLCARKPLMAGIARKGKRQQVDFSRRGGSDDGGGGGGVGASMNGEVAVHAGDGGGYSGSDDSSEGARGDVERPRRERTGVVLGTTGVEIQVWNYRTKRPLVRHRFGDCSSGSDDGGGGDDVAGEVGAPGGGVEADEGGDGGGERGDAAIPVAISLHPSGDFIAVAFPHYVNVFYIVGRGCDALGKGHGGGCGVTGGSGGGGRTNMLSSTDASVPPLTLGAALSVDAAESDPLAVLRSDQREFMTKGMFSVAGEQDPVINSDPVSALNYSPGGHLLAVVTGKVRLSLTIFVLVAIATKPARTYLSC